MAAPMRLSTFICQSRFCAKYPQLTPKLSLTCNRTKLLIPRNQNTLTFRPFSQHGSSFKQGFSHVSGSTWKKVGLAGGITLGLIYLADLYQRSSTVFADVPDPFKFKPVRRILSETDSSGLKMTIFQYQNCPFCCRVRSYLDYHGFSYNVVEVNSVWRTQTKWTKYKKIPILVIQGQGEDGYLQIGDSSVIVSVLETYLVDQTLSLQQILEYYPSIEAKNKRGKTVLEYPNKYFVMYNEKNIDKSRMKELERERNWRSWNDDVLIHTISPNIYRSWSEAIQAFRYFSDVGQWDKVFTTPERMLVIYVGTAAMFFIGKMLKKRHSLKDDVRESLYDACREWTHAVGTKHPFLGGDQPNIADISVYGSLLSMEGCTAFSDAQNTTKIGPWFNRMKDVINKNAGHPLPDTALIHSDTNATV